MATKNMSYDHPAYTSVGSLTTGNLTGASGAGQKYAAFTSMLIKSITLKPTTAGTSADAASFLQISGTATTTTALNTFGSGATGFVNTVLTTNSLMIQGDTFWVQKGTDATGVQVGMIEYVVQPLANVTA